MTREMVQILQHAVGADNYGITMRGERNHFCAGKRDEPLCRELVRLGYMVEHHTTDIFPYYNCSVTAEGRVAMRENSDIMPHLTRSQRRYREFLKRDNDQTFGEFLKESRIA